MVVVGSWIKFGLFKTSSLSPDVTPVEFLVVARNEGFGISEEIADLKAQNVWCCYHVEKHENTGKARFCSFITDSLVRRQCRSIRIYVTSHFESDATT